MSRKNPYKIDRKTRVISVELDAPKHGFEAALGAAYALADRAAVLVDGDRQGRIKIRLQADEGADCQALGDAFWAALADQKILWSVAKKNTGVVNDIARQAMLAADGQLPEPSQGGGEELTSEQQEEISRLIAEVEEEIKELKTRKDLKDTGGIAATWEERHRKGSGE